MDTQPAPSADLLTRAAPPAPAAPTFGDWRAYAHKWAPHVETLGFVHGAQIELFQILAKLHTADQELPEYWADYLIDVWQGRGPNLYQMSVSFRDMPPIFDSPNMARQILTGGAAPLARLLTKITLDGAHMVETTADLDAGQRANVMPHVKELIYIQEGRDARYRTANRPSEADEQRAGEALAGACRYLERLEWGGGPVVEAHTILDLDRILRACPHLHTVSAALPTLEDAPGIKRISLRQAALYDETQRVERRLERLGKLESLQLTQLREIASPPARTALARLAHVKAATLQISQEIHAAHRDPQGSLKWIADAAKVVDAQEVYIFNTPHTVAHVTRAFRGSGIKVRWETPKRSREEREEQF